MKKLALYVLASATLLGCGSDDSRPGVMPGLPPGGTVQPNTPNQGQGDSDSNLPPTDSNTPPLGPGNNTDNEVNSRVIPGIYSGMSTVVGSGSYFLNGLVDDDENLWFIHTKSKKGDILGFTKSSTNISGSNGSFSVKGVEYSYEDQIAIPITIEGNYSAENMITGKTYDKPSNASNYNVSYDESLSNQKQSLSMVDNKTFFGDTYITGDDGKARGTVNFGSNGNFTGKVETCAMSGKLIPAGSSRYFNANVKFASTGCFVNGETQTGVALVGENGELILLGTNDTKSRGVFFDGDLK